jgi:hypothetical protein
MSPSTARQILEAWRNEYRPPRTHGARVMDALQLASNSRIKNAVGEDGAKNIHHDRKIDELHENYRTSTPDPHL